MVEGITERTEVFKDENTYHLKTKLVFDGCLEIGGKGMQYSSLNVFTYSKLGDHAETLVLPSDSSVEISPFSKRYGPLQALIVHVDTIDSLVKLYKEQMKKTASV